MRVNVVGGGPAGLFFALLLRKSDPRHEVTVFERNRADDTFGWGVVFSDATLENLAAADPVTHQRITDHFAHWDDIDIHFRGRTITSGGHGFSGIARKRLLHILQQRALEVGVECRFEHDITVDALHQLKAESDLLVAADGANSLVRRTWSDHFRPELDQRSARFIWLGTPLQLGAFTFIIVENEYGVFQVHAYRFDRELSTFIVECDERSWYNAGFDRMDAAATVATCERWFAEWLHGQPLLFNASHQQHAPWQRFLRVRNESWWFENVVLLGDAAHTAHFSIGSGTKLALEDAISLAGAGWLSAGGLVGDAASRRHDAGGVLITATPPPPGVAGADTSRGTTSSGGAEAPSPTGGLAAADALAIYQSDRQTEALKLQNAARNSMLWFENVRRYVHLEPEQFAYSLLTRSQRVSHENLRLRDRGYLEGVERWFCSRAQQTEAVDAIPPALTPYTMRGLAVSNRIVVSPMDMYSAVDGTPNDFHLVHLGARALGGAGLVFTEMTCVSPEGRISIGCTGLYNDEQLAAWKRIVRFVHEWSPAKICLQLGHSGRKGSTQKMWEGMDRPLPSGNWPVIGPSPLPYSSENQTPREMTRADMEQIRDEFVRATELAIVCGFDMLELHCAHGYLLSSFITPVSNQRTDEYGGSLDNRLRYPLEVFRAMREVWPQDKPMSVRISATDWVEHGISEADAAIIGRAFVDAGADIIHVSTGQTTPEARPVYGRMYQTPYSDLVRNEARVPTIAVGNITELDQANAIIAAGRADLVAIGRPHLADPQWTFRQAALLGYKALPWPPQYLTGKSQLERLLDPKR